MIAHSKKRAAQKGNVALFSFLSLVPTIALLGGAVDVSRAVHARSELQQAIDSAALAAASLTNERDMQDVAEEFLRSNLTTSSVQYDDVQFTINASLDNEGKKVNIRGDYTLETSFLKVIDIDTLNVVASSGGRHDWQKVEIALVLDVSGSMASNGKIADLRDAAETFLDLVLTPEVEDITTISIIPFATHVRVGDPDFFTDDPYRVYVDPDDWDTGHDNNRHDGRRHSGCYDIPPEHYVDRVFPYYYNLDPGEEPVRPLQQFYYNSQRSCPRDENQALFLTNNMSVLLGKVRGLTSENAWANRTSIDEGTVFGLQALNPAMRGRFSGPFTATHPTDYHGDTYKVIIIMSDGDMVKMARAVECSGSYSDNEGWYWNYYGNYRRCEDWPLWNSLSEQNTLNMCDSANNNGITVYTIGFAISPGSRADTLLSGCAAASSGTGSASNYYLAEDGDAVNDAFESIAAHINRVRIYQ